MKKPILTVHDLVIEYPRPGKPPFRAVKGISFDVRENEFFGIVGESGCGKSTLAKALCGLQPIASGSAAFDALPRGAVQMIFLTHGGSEQAVRRALCELNHDIASVCSMIRVEGV